MFKKLAPWVQTLKADFAGAVDAQTKKAVLVDAQTVLDAMFSGNAIITDIANFIVAELESTIK